MHSINLFPVCRVKNAPTKFLSMETFKNASRKTPWRFIWLAITVMALLIAVVIWVIDRYINEKRFAVVQLYGNGPALNLSKNYNFSSFSSGRKNKGAILAEEDDLLALNNTFIYFNNVKNDSLEVNDKGDSLVFVNGNINTIIISDSVNLIPWFRSRTDADISQLETIYFSSKIPAGYLPYLKEIARLKPTTSLVFEEDDSSMLLNDYVRQADLFSPRFIKVSITQDKFNLLSRWQHTECLYLDLLDSLVTASLPALPALQECILYADNIKSIAPSFFNNNPQLRKVSILASIPDYSLLEPLPNLQVLAINNQERVAGMEALTNKLNKLAVLIVSGNYTNVDLLLLGKKLRWLGLPANTSQQQLNTLATNLTGLQVLEITGSDSITDLAVLQQMPSLRSLVITDTVTDKQSLYALKELRYLSLPQNNKEDSAYLFAIEKALPGCIVVPNSGACLGSGWLLLLAPLVLLSSIILRRKWMNKLS
jgi:hypothetical protein